MSIDRTKKVPWLIYNCDTCSLCPKYGTATAATATQAAKLFRETRSSMIPLPRRWSVKRTKANIEMEEVTITLDSTGQRPGEVTLMASGAGAWAALPPNFVHSPGTEMIQKLAQKMDEAAVAQLAGASEGCLLKVNDICAEKIDYSGGCSGRITATASEIAKARLLGTTYGADFSKLEASLLGAYNDYKWYGPMKYEQLKEEKTMKYGRNDVAMLVSETGVWGNALNRHSADGEWTETPAEFEARVQRQAMKQSISQCTPVAILTASKSVMIPVTVTELKD